MISRNDLAYASLLLCLGAVGPAIPVHVAAQNRLGDPVVVALPDAFPEIEARAIVVRDARRSVVLLNRSDAIPETLDVALRVLERIDAPGRASGRGQIVPITGYVAEGELRTERWLTLAGVLADLQNSPVVRLGSLGLGRWVPYRPR